jgi:chromosome segregation ATPase
LYLRYIDSADKVHKLTKQLDDAGEFRKQLEGLLQEAKLERARAMREKEAAAMASADIADEAEGLKLEVEELRKAAEERDATISALETELRAREEEIARLQAFVHKVEVLEVEAGGLKMKARAAQVLRTGCAMHERCSAAHKDTNACRLDRTACAHA